MMGNNGILSGIRVVELSQLIAIPYATKLMSDMGAETIRLESAKRPDAYRLSDFYDERLDGDYWNRAINFNEQNKIASIRLIFLYIRDMLRWPYLISVHCYWGAA